MLMVKGTDKEMVHISQKIVFESFVNFKIAIITKKFLPAVMIPTRTATSTLTDTLSFSVESE